MQPANTITGDFAAAATYDAGITVVGAVFVNLKNGPCRMPYIAVAETAENNRNRFIAGTIDEAITELGTLFPIGKTVEERLRKGERIITDGYTLVIIPLASAPPKKQQSLF